MVRRFAHPTTLVMEVWTWPPRIWRAIGGPWWTKVWVMGVTRGRRAAWTKVGREHVGRRGVVTRHGPRGRGPKEGTRMAIWVGREWHTHVGREAAGDIVHLVDPLLLAPLVLEPHLDHPHRQARLLGELLSHLPCWLWVLVKAVLENLKLFCFDCRSWSPPLSILGQLSLLLRHVHRVPALLLIVRPGAVSVWCLCLPLHC